MILRYSEDIRSIGLVVVYFALTYLAWHCDKSILVLPVSFFSFAGAIIVHNSIHAKMFYSETLNSLAQLILTIVYGHPVSSFVPGHNLGHHKYTQLQKDVMRTTKLRYKWHFLNGLLFQFTIVGDVAKYDLRYMRLQRILNYPYFKQAVTEYAFLISYKVFLLCCDWRKTLLYIHLPHTFAQWAIVSMNMLQHDGCYVNKTPEVSKNPFGNNSDKRIYYTSRNFTGSFINYFFFNNGYHTIHHFRPGLHWSELPKEHYKHVSKNLAPYNENLEQPNMLTYIWKTFFWPGKRIMYDGSPMTFEDEENTDVNWIRYPPKKVSSEWVQGELKKSYFELLKDTIWGSVPEVQTKDISEPATEENLSSI